QAPLHATGQHAGAVVAFVPQTELAQIFLGALACESSRQAVVTTLRHDDIGNLFEGTEIDFLWHHAEVKLGFVDVRRDIATEHPDFAGTGLYQGGDDADHGRLA